MINRLFFICAVLVVSTLAGCDSENSTTSSDEKSQIFVLKNQVAQLQTDLNSLTDKVSDQSQSLAVFTPGTTGYSYIRSNVGYFIVSLESLTKYANGYKATFSIGNPALITYNGIKVHVVWGSTYPGDINYNDWINSLFSEDIDVIKPILPGVWNRVSVVLSPATPHQTGFIGLSITDNLLELTPDTRAY